MVWSLRDGLCKSPRITFRSDPSTLPRSLITRLFAVAVVPSKRAFRGRSLAILTMRW